MTQTLQLPRRLEQALASGHPWIYRNHLPQHRLQHGDWVRLHAGASSAIGLYDAESAIAIRLFQSEQIPDYAWAEAQVAQALALRQLMPAATNAYRLIYGESDGLPAIVADRYDRYVVIKTYADSVQTILPDVVKALSKQLKLKGILHRNAADLTPLWGELPPPEVTIEEHGLRFIANLYEGQKTGLFLDQRDNRQYLRQLSRGLNVLNLFSYTGGFSVYALAGGAAQVTAVDIAPAANRDAERNVALNQLPKHTAVTADAFALLQSYAQEGRQFDLVILDPPSLAKNKGQRYSALRAYKRLNSLAMRCVKPAGLLATASCTAQIDAHSFVQMLAQTTYEVGVRAQLIHEAGQAPDHPVALNFPEGRYLKFVVLRLLTG
jgi:23S rRNA (cytosine1962-C5)-methyltransferase